MESLINSLFVLNVDAQSHHDKLKLLEDFWKMRGCFVAFNEYHSTFDPHCRVDFKYLITILVKEGSLQIFSCLDEILHLFGKVVDKDIANGSLHYMITLLVVTTHQTFDHFYEVEFEDGKTSFVDFEFCQPNMRCANYFAYIGTLREGLQDSISPPTTKALDSTVHYGSKFMPPTC